LLTKALKKHAQPFSQVQEQIVLDDIIFKDPSNSDMWHSVLTGNKVNKIITLAKQKLGHKYVWGATGKTETFDCSGFTKYVYQKNGINLPRTSINQSKYGKYVSRSQLKPGDLVFFDTSKERKGYVNHVGIYIGHGEFLHASSAKKKVVISKLDKTFYGKRFKVARRPS
jgi:cell wall-associated NlpC family hydrolase